MSPEARALRLFVHWTGEDVDLSLVGFDDAMQSVETIWYRNLAGDGFAHSGDVRQAPRGASEFIDVSLATARERRIRYLTMSLISYKGGPFSGFPCFAGVMERDDLLSGAPYDPATVRLKFDITIPACSGIPLVFDLEERKVIWVDFATGGRDEGNVVTSAATIAALTRAAVDLPAIKPTAYDVLAAYASARGTIVFRPEVADTVYRAAEIDLESVAALLDLDATPTSGETGPAR